jgi:hypothetical protein
MSASHPERADPEAAPSLSLSCIEPGSAADEDQLSPCRWAAQISLYSRPILVGKPAKNLRDAAALPGSGESESVFDRR